MAINYDFTSKSTKINLEALRTTTDQLPIGLIKPAKEEVDEFVVEEHSAEPIKSMDDIQRISDYLIDTGRFRDNMMFIVGINFGLRASDLRMLRFANLINENNTFKTTFPVFERKTRNTRKKRLNRYITINTAVKEAVTLYLENTDDVCLSDFLFVSESTNGLNSGSPISVRSMNRILKDIALTLGLDIRFSSHTLRKTFCYHQMVMSNNDSRKLQLLQKMLGHSSMMQTLTYIGITNDEIANAYQNLNLGSREHNYLNSTIEEGDLLVG